jgi:uncharacterized FAD-dependent dehydrogenase
MNVEDISVSSVALTSVTVNGERYFTDAAVFATGHSARDIFAMLAGRGAALSAKSFAVGLRIEHLQRDIDAALYGKHAGDARLPKGEYALSYDASGTPVYTFCMCPGGSVVAAASAKGGVVVNGMSSYKRGGVNANSAVVAAVDASMFSGDAFRAVAFQQDLERRAFLMGGGTYAAPASDVKSFLNNTGGLSVGRIEPTYPLGVTPCNLNELLGDSLSESLKYGLMAFSEKIRGFDADDAILTGVESRTSSPVRVLRNDDRQATVIRNLYPAGEGAGYAGGIMSSAVDGLKTAAAIIERYHC